MPVHVESVCPRKDLACNNIITTFIIYIFGCLLYSVIEVPFYIEWEYFSISTWIFELDYTSYYCTNASKQNKTIILLLLLLVAKNRILYYLYTRDRNVIFRNNISSYYNYLLNTYLFIFFFFINNPWAWSNRVFMTYYWI